MKENSFNHPDNIKKRIKDRVESQIDNLSGYRETVSRSFYRDKSKELFGKAKDESLENNYPINRIFESRFFTLHLHNIYADKKETVILYELYKKSWIQKVIYALGRLLFSRDKSFIEFCKRPMMPKWFIAARLSFEQLIGKFLESSISKTDIFRETNNEDIQGFPSFILGRFNLQVDEMVIDPFYTEARYIDDRMEGILYFPPLPRPEINESHLFLNLHRDLMLPLVEKNYYDSTDFRKLKISKNNKEEEEYYKTLTEKNPPGIVNIIPVLKT